MILAIDIDRFTAAGLAFETVDSDGLFWRVVDGERDPNILVRVPLVGGQLQFFPKRSAAQREVLVLLDEPIPS